MQGKSLSALQLMGFFYNFKNKTVVLIFPIIQ